MLDNIRQLVSNRLDRESVRRAFRVRLYKLLAGVFGMILLSSPAAASHDSLECDPPSSLEPLFSLLDTIAQLAFLGGVGLGTVGFSVAALMIMMPGQEWSRRGKNLAKRVLFGLILLLSSNAIVSFLVNEMGSIVCG